MAAIPAVRGRTVGGAEWCVLSDGITDHTAESVNGFSRRAHGGRLRDMGLPLRRAARFVSFVIRCAIVLLAAGVVWIFAPETRVVGQPASDAWETGGPSELA